MVYREFLDLTDDEITFILNDIFHSIKIENIQRDMESNWITAEITTGGWDDGEGGTMNITDTILLELPTPIDSGIEVNFSLGIDDKWKYRQFLLAKGCDARLKDNPYLD